MPFKPKAATVKTAYHVEEAMTVHDATDRIKSILDAKYEAADLEKVCSAQDQLKLGEQQKLLALLNKYASLFDGTLGKWNHDPIELELHEYLQHVLREQPVYSFSELKNAATPYGATVSVQSVQYGSGYGSSKRQAKSEAARATLQIFIPNLMEQIEGDKTVSGSAKPTDMDLSFFDSVRLEDPRVADLCSKASEPSPFTILLICLQRNFGLTGNQVACKLHTTKYHHNQYEMTVGKHTACVPCKNKKDGKHLAAQSLLQVGSGYRASGSGSSDTDARAGA